MPFLIPLIPAIATGLGATATTAATIGTAANVAGGLYAGYQALNQGKKATNAAGQAGNSSQVDIAALDEQVRAISKQNALDSAELERQLTPEVPALRSAANQGVLAGLGATPGETAGTNLLMANLGNGARSPLLEAAIAKAKADLGLGGQLDVDTQNAVTRQGLARAGAVGGGGLGLGRDVVARDLGLTSLQLQQQRLQNASGLGAAELGGQQFNAGNLLQQIQMLKSISDGQFGRNLAAGQYGESIRQPVIGLDPSSVANIAVGNQNARGAALANQADIYGNSANNWLRLLGTAASSYGNAGKPITMPASGPVNSYGGSYFGPPTT